jgi:hypothetical protein
VITDLERRIYNKHLAVSRSLRGKAFRLKQDFNDFDKDPKYLFIKRLAIFFSKYPDVNMDTYFIAPYKLYKDVQYFDLSYFASPRAIKTYTIYKQQLLQESPDAQKDDVKESLSFLVRYCLQNSIQLHDYIYHREKSIEPIWTYHIKHNKINPYVLMEFPNIFHTIQEMPKDEREFLLGRFGTNFLEYRTRYMHSKELRPFLEKAFIRLKLFVDKNLNSAKYQP